MAKCGEWLYGGLKDISVISKSNETILKEREKDELMDAGGTASNLFCGILYNILLYFARLIQDIVV